MAAVPVALPTASGDVLDPDGKPVDEISGLIVVNGTVTLRAGGASGVVVLSATGPASILCPTPIRTPGGLYATCTSTPVASVLL